MTDKRDQAGYYWRFSWVVIGAEQIDKGEIYDDNQ